MSYIIGIDIGGSTTKIVGINGGKMKSPIIVKASDPVASLFGAFGKYVDLHNLELSDIERIVITGVGASHIKKPMYGLPTAKAPEFLANGLGGLYLSGLNQAVIVSMGTGTAIVKANNEHIEYIGGTGVGGGTIIGLANKMINIRDIELIIKTAETGDLNNIDLMVGDITVDEVPGLHSHTTASNFGKISDIASNNDVALGILNLVFQSIGTASAFVAKNMEQRDIVLIGNLSAFPYCQQIFPSLGTLYNVNFVIPENSEYATAVGAALAPKKAKSLLSAYL